MYYLGYINYVCGKFFTYLYTEIDLLREVRHTLHTDGREGRREKHRQDIFLSVFARKLGGRQSACWPGVLCATGYEVIAECG